MKKLLAVILCCVFALSFTACADNKAGTSDTTKITATTETAETTAPTEVAKLNITDEKIAKIEDKLDDINGIVYITHGGELIYSHCNGKDECGNELTVDTPMYVGSLSKQFCATAIMILKEQGKLSVDDTLEKYFPEFKNGKDVTIKNLLTMRSGISDMVEESEGFLNDKTDSENAAIILEWILNQTLTFEPDSTYEYSNTNYFLLSQIVEKVSGQPYNDFVRENIFEPLKMNQSGFVTEVKDNDFFSNSLTYDTFYYNDEHLAFGAGDIVTTAPDIDKWMTGLQSSKVITDESYREMIEDYSPDTGLHYGYGIQGMYKKGKGHTGHIGDYYAIDYFSEDYDCNIYAVNRGEENNKMMQIPDIVMEILLDN